MTPTFRILQLRKDYNTEKKKRKNSGEVMVVFWRVQCQMKKRLPVEYFRHMGWKTVPYPL